MMQWRTSVNMVIHLRVSDNLLASLATKNFQRCTT